MLSDTSAATSIEYALIAVILSISVVTGMQLIGSELTDTFLKISDGFGRALTP